jgi:hypothetical protein
MYQESRFYKFYKDTLVRYYLDKNQPSKPYINIRHK